MSAGKVFFDTNVLLYMHSDANPTKRDQSTALYQEHASAGRALLSTQVVQEFFVNATRKLQLPREQVCDLALAFLELPLVVVGPAHIRAAMENELKYRISFWDALILAAADAGGAEVLYTEHLNDGQQYGNVVARNPFRAVS